MKFPRFFPAIAIALACQAGVMASTHAQSDDGASRERASAPRAEESGRDWRATPPSQRASSLSDAVRRVHRETGGQVLGAERVQFDGRDINRIKVLDDRGRVRYMDDDPQRGRRVEQPRDESRARGDNPSNP